MNNKKISLLAFIALAIIQISIPAWMIMHREDIKSGGKTYHFLCQPIDPNDPFRGKYIILRFDAETVNNVDERDQWTKGDVAYASLNTNAEDHAYISKLSRTAPSNTDFIEVTVNSAVYNGTVQVTLPFTRYYMEESKAPKAEALYRSSIFDKEIIALVKVKAGNAVLTKVLVDGQPIEKAVEQLAN